MLAFFVLCFRPRLVTECDLPGVDDEDSQQLPPVSV